MEGGRDGGRENWRLSIIVQAKPDSIWFQAFMLAFTRGIVKQSSNRVWM